MPPIHVMQKSFVGELYAGSNERAHHLSEQELGTTTKKRMVEFISSAG